MIRGIGDSRIDNVEIVGFVFQKAIQHSLLATKPGSITFQDCEWTVRSNIETKSRHRFHFLIFTNT
jgi:hypothetical protein